MSRFKVATCTGYPIGNGSVGNNSKAGTTASVLDTRNAHREVKRFRSEDRRHVYPSRHLGVDGARRAAQEYADKLNAECEPA